MNYNMTTPCAECPFLNTLNMRRGFTLQRLKEFARGEFPCHKTADIDEDGDAPTGDFIARESSAHCAGQLIFNEKRGTPTKLSLIVGRLGLYDRRQLNMKAKVR